ncbi:MAG: DUF4386 family protein [Chloroflexota bacterium]
MNTTNSTTRNWTAALLILQGLLLFVPVFILGGAINWPASLGEPASVNLPLILAEAAAVRNGYFIYMIYSALILPVAVLTAKLAAGDEPLGTVLQMAIGFGIASAVLRVLGIIRWLIPMPILARIYTDPASSDATREAVVVTYDMLNGYAGSVGEVLGVGIFAALWIACTSIVMWQRRTVPRWFAAYGFVTAAGLATGLVEIWGIDLGAFITVTVSLFQFWMLILGGLLLMRSRAPQRQVATA